ncbi:hypothetical protein E2C01_072923 [Portunus trituberculatus]|uniref:Uncharacterized protein n=1 Tax=Portunus trituberculatus TaxID=210409 RepID=A0A5B7IA95_PORTR|nr:hypothetical protein [Portunus trituberculatus]
MVRQTRPSITSPQQEVGPQSISDNASRDCLVVVVLVVRVLLPHPALEPHVAQDWLGRPSLYKVCGGKMREAKGDFCSEFTCSS